MNNKTPSWNMHVLLKWKWSVTCSVYCNIFFNCATYQNLETNQWKWMRKKEENRRNECSTLPVLLFFHINSWNYLCIFKINSWISPIIYKKERKSCIDAIVYIIKNIFHWNFTKHCKMAHNSILLWLHTTH